MANAHGPIILALDLRIFDITLEEQFQSRTADLVAWTKTMLPVIRHSISEARKQLRTGDQDIRTSFSDTAAPERTMNAALNPATASTTNTDRISSRPTAIRWRPQQTRTQPNPTSSTGPDIMTFILIYLPRQRQNQPRTRCKPPRKNRTLPQSVPSPVYAPFTTKFRKQEPG
jgi:hypothetical protein